jgi:hypothetical protein
MVINANHKGYFCALSERLGGARFSIAQNGGFGGMEWRMIGLIGPRGRMEGGVIDRAGIIIYLSYRHYF